MSDLADMLEQEADEITCYASTTKEHRPNRTAKILRNAATELRRLAARPEEQARLAWLEEQSTLHKSVEILYVVDGYEVQVMHEDGVTELSPRFHGSTLGEAIDKARSQPQGER